MKTLIIGFDAFDHAVFGRLAAEGRLPNLTRLAERGACDKLAVANPPQTEVSWTSMATGLNPGGHGLFDFVHRHPATYEPYVSLLPTRRGLGGTHFVPPYDAPTLFDTATRGGYPATALWWPALFPARPERTVRSIPGLGTPDIHGKLGVGVLYTSDTKAVEGVRKTRVEALRATGAGRYTGELHGPGSAKRDGAQRLRIGFDLQVQPAGAARLAVGGAAYAMPEGAWTPVIHVTFRGRLGRTVHAITRAVVSRTAPDVRLYFTPLQLHPVHSLWRYGTPGSFVKETWKQAGPFLTLGWPQDTTALEDGCITTGQFLRLCRAIDLEREKVCAYHLQRFEEGVLAVVFDSLDRVQHMFRERAPDTVRDWYERYDGVLGRLLGQLDTDGGDATQVLVLSDHGFAPFHYKVHLNRWLCDAQHLVYRADSEAKGLRDVDWAQTGAYAVGLNSVYINRKGREGRGCLDAEAAGKTVEAIRQRLLAWRGPDGNTVVEQVWSNREAFEGGLAELGPDLVVGYRPGYRASSETGLGQCGACAVEANKDHWEADHCVNVAAVPGVIFSNRDNLGPHPSYHDVPVLATGRMPEGAPRKPPVAHGAEEDDAMVEERMRSLGYL